MGDEFSGWQKETTRSQKSADVCFDRALLHKLEVAEKEASAAGDGMLATDKGEVESIRDEIKSKTRTLVFEAIGKRQWRDLLGEHPPAREQREQTPGLDYNPETFPAAAMAAACVQPGLTLEQAQWLCDELPLGVVERVWLAVLDANVIGGDEKKAVTARPQVGETKSTPALPLESLEASS